MIEDEDKFILQRIKAGDESAFKFLFESFFSPLCKFVRFYVSRKGIAEEIVLDIFTSIWENRKSFELQQSFKTYLFQAAKNRSFNYLRDNERFVVTDNFSFMEKFEQDYSLEAKELQLLIEEAVCSLPEKCGDIFRKSRTENLSNKEIAQQLNVTVKAVEAQITKALKYIRKYLDEAYYYFL